MVFSSPFLFQAYSLLYWSVLRIFVRLHKVKNPMPSRHRISVRHEMAHDFSLNLPCPLLSAFLACFHCILFVKVLLDVIQYLLRRLTVLVHKYVENRRQKFITRCLRQNLL